MVITGEENKPFMFPYDDIHQRSTMILLLLLMSKSATVGQNCACVCFDSMVRHFIIIRVLCAGFLVFPLQDAIGEQMFILHMRKCYCFNRLFPSITWIHR